MYLLSEAYELYTSLFLSNNLSERLLLWRVESWPNHSLIIKLRITRFSQWAFTNCILRYHAIKQHKLNPAYLINLF